MFDAINPYYVGMMIIFAMMWVVTMVYNRRRYRRTESSQPTIAQIVLIVISAIVWPFTAFAAGATVCGLLLYVVYDKLVAFHKAQISRRESK